MICIRCSCLVSFSSRRFLRLAFFLRLLLSDTVSLSESLLLLPELSELSWLLLSLLLLSLLELQREVFFFLAVDLVAFELTPAVLSLSAFFELLLLLACLLTPGVGCSFVFRGVVFCVFAFSSLLLSLISLSLEELLLLVIFISLSCSSFGIGFVIPSRVV